MVVLTKREIETTLKEENLLIRSGVLREENPLDQSDEFAEFMEACRRGDLGTCQQLMAAGVNINGRDAFDNTPLILASLCGHYDLVRYLLDSGAVAERSTFQGERCIYNALNDKIRKLLLQYDYSKSTDPLQPWSSHIASLLNLPFPRTTDISLVGPHESYQLHKFILAARVPYFRERLRRAPETQSWNLPASIPLEAFRIVFRYIYLGELPADIAGVGGSGATEEEILRGIDKLCRFLGLENVWDGILAIHDRRLARQRFQDEVQRAVGQIELFFLEFVLGQKIELVASAVGDLKWTANNNSFADCLVQAGVPDDDDDSPDDDDKIDDEEDSMQATDEATEPTLTAIYPAHKAMLARSDYFRAMFQSGFLESQPSEHLRIFHVDCSPEVLEIVLQFLYTEKVECPFALALELMYTADMLLLDKLKMKAASIIYAMGSGRAGTGSASAARKVDGTVVTADSIDVYEILRAAWELRMPRLEEFAARYIASRLENFVDKLEFEGLILASALRLQKRETVDSIELLDDIRYYLDERFRHRFEPTAVVTEEEEESGAANGAGGANPRPAAAPAANDGQPEKLRTIAGGLVDDEFELAAANFAFLTHRIDCLLQRLELDA